MGSTPTTAQTDTAIPRSGSGDQARSVEAMVMSMPFLGKIKILRKIAPPLKSVGPASLAPKVRGSIIAVEGDDSESVEAVTQWLDNFLQSREQCTTKLVDGPKLPEKDAKVDIGQYIGLIGDWHGRSQDMVRFITGADSVPEDTATKEGTDNGTEREEVAIEDADMGGTEKAPPTPTPQEKQPSKSFDPTPVLLLPTYQLRASDAYASRVPIQDAYAPADHWQWMATLWRGIIGPDITIYIKSVGAKEMETAEKIVEIREEKELRCLVVRKERGGKVEERALRRVGFEVGEWVRGIAGGISRE